METFRTQRDHWRIEEKPFQENKSPIVSISNSQSITTWFLYFVELDCKVEIKIHFLYSPTITTQRVSPVWPECLFFPGHYFIVEDDVRELAQMKVDKRFQGILNMLRHCQRFREVRGGGVTRYLLLWADRTSNKESPPTPCKQTSVSRAKLVCKGFSFVWQMLFKKVSQLFI